MKNVMVINMGLKNIRCIIFDESGHALANSSCSINTEINEKCVEQNPLEWWEKAVKVIKEAHRECGFNRIDYITVTASAACLICVDEEGKPLTNAYMISDKRAEVQSEKIKCMEEFAQVRKETGLLMDASLMLPRILWVKEELNSVFERCYRFLTPNDYMLFKLCGRYVTDELNALKYHYNIKTKQYPNKFLRTIGLKEDAFPEVHRVGEEVGFISENVARELGLNVDIKVMLTSYDAICSFFGSGASQEGEASDVSGTVTVFRAISRRKDLQINPNIYQIPFLMENASLIGGSNNMGGGLIEWVKQCYYQKEDYPYELMGKEAAESSVGARGLLFLPYLLGERAPIWDNNARGVFFGIERMHTRQDMTRAVFESAGFIALDMLHAVEQTGIEVKSVRLSGGVSRIPLISQIKADMLGKDVMVMSEFESTAAGAAMIALTGAGVFKCMEQAAQCFTRVRMLIKPDMKNYEKYQYMYELYKETYKSLKDLFEKRKQIVARIQTEREVQIENL